MLDHQPKNSIIKVLLPSNIYCKELEQSIAVFHGTMLHVKTGPILDDRLKEKMLKLFKGSPQ